MISKGLCALYQSKTCISPKAILDTTAKNENYEVFCFILLAYLLCYHSIGIQKLKNVWAMIDQSGLDWCVNVSRSMMWMISVCLNTWILLLYICIACIFIILASWIYPSNRILHQNKEAYWLWWSISSTQSKLFHESSIPMYTSYTEHVFQWVVFKKTFIKTKS